MSIEADVRTRLITQVAIGGRVYPLVLPQGAVLPALTYQRISAPRTHGVGGVPILARPRLQLNCWAPTYAAARSLAESVRQALDGYHGTSAEVGPWTAIVANDHDDYDAAPAIYRVILDVLIDHAEAS